MWDDPASRPRPLNFGASARRLFGMFHPGASVAAPAPGVLLCNAFGQEAIRTHRFMRVLAERLARLGHPVLRFDYFGTGDSVGDDQDADLETWAADVLEADRELRTLAGCAERVWFGLRLGGGLVLHTAPAAPGGLLRVVVWEPVVDGVGYLARLREQHVKTLEMAFSLTPHPRPCDVAADPAAYRDEAIGFALPQRLREQLTALAWPAASALAAANAVVVVADPESAEGRAVLLCAGAAGPRVTTLPLLHGVDWMRDTADNTPLVPGPALQALLQQIAGTA